MLNINDINTKLCTGCGACMCKCPLGAISVVPNEKGFFAPVIDKSICVECGACYNVCPINSAVEKSGNLVAYSGLTASAAFEALFSYVLSCGGVVFGSRISDDGYWAFAERAESGAAAGKIVIDPYIHSDMRKTFAEAKEALEAGKTVLFVASPCQIAGLKNYLGFDSPKLYTVDYACDGAESVRAYQSFLFEYTLGKEFEKAEFNKKGPIATAVYFKDGTEKKSPSNDSRWLEGVGGITENDPCFDCVYRSEKRVSDISFAYDVDNVGFVLTVNTKNGKKLFEYALEKSGASVLSAEDAAELEKRFLKPLSRKADRDYFFSHLDKGYHKALWYGRGMRFDVGIVGWWFASNYGSSLTYYALARILEGMGKKPIFIHVPKLDGTGWDKDAEQTISFIGKRFRIANYRDMLHIHEVNNFCDSFMLGSDQMWTPLATNLVGYTFFLDFVDLDKKKIAFSTSFGQDKFLADKTICDTTSDYLKRFDAISVREYTGVDICKDTFGIDAEQIIDPVFLCDADCYDRLTEGVNVKTPAKYLLSYILDPTPEKEAAVRDIAKREKLEVLSVFSMRDYKENSEKWHVGTNLPKPTTEEFLCYVKNASYMVTDSHHGACMAIIYKRNYAAITNSSRGVTRFETVANAFGLQSRVLYSPLDAINNAKIHEPIDYDAVFQRIDSEKARAVEWLKAAFEKETVAAEETVNTMRAKLDVYKRGLANTVNSYERRLKAAPAAKAPAAPPELENNFDFIKIRLLGTLLKDYGIKHIVLSPGGRDVPIIRMFEQNENEFTIHRVTDERSAAYFGLGLASYLNKPVACVCTSGTAASNYLPAVTEAYFTGIPLVMITADRINVYHGQGEDQTIPQKDIYRDVVKMAVSLPDAAGASAEYQVRRDISACILETTHNNYGPVHINIPIQDIGIGANAPKGAWKLLPTIQPHILRASFTDGDSDMHRWVKALKHSPRILVVYGQNKPLSKEEKTYVESFASKYNCAIVTDSISNYQSEYSVNPFNMLSRITQAEFDQKLKPDILITVGGKRLMNDPLTFKIRAASGVRHWSVTPDGSIKDFYFKLSSVIESTQAQFFRWFADNAGMSKNNRVYLNAWKSLVANHTPNLATDFNSFYIQDKLFPSMPKNSFLHLGVGQSFFFVRRHDINPDVEVFCNMGTNGIDGCTSTFMGQCAIEKEKLAVLIVGDLSFFYDMNAIWNKTLGKNARILLVNNNGSGLLKNHNLRAVTSVHNTEAEGWVRSTNTFEYIRAENAEDFDEKLKYFLSGKPKKAVFFEVICN